MILCIAFITPSAAVRLRTMSFALLKMAMATVAVLVDLGVVQSISEEIFEVIEALEAQGLWRAMKSKESQN